MKRFVFVLLLCCSFAFAGTSADAVDDLKEKHKSVNDAHKAHKRELENIKNILKRVLLSQANIIFEMYKESNLLFFAMQAEGESQIMTNRILKELLK